MNTQIRRLGIAMLIAYVAVFVQLNYVQVYRAESLNEHPENNRQILRDFTRPRGTVTTADGTLLAESVPVDDRFERQRQYPTGDLFGHVTGFFSLEFGAEGLEREYNDDLAGQTAEQELRSFAELFVDKERTGNLTLALRADLQALAREQLGERRGSVVVIDPRTGAVLAMWSFPSYNPNDLSTHDFAAAQGARDFLLGLDDPNNAFDRSPLAPAAYRERFFPGSTFKVVTGATGVQSGVVTATDPVYPDVTEYTPPQTNLPLQNFGGSVCGGDFFTILARSCNTSFAQMAVEDIGPDRMIGGAESWGFNDTPPLDLPAPAESVFPTDFTDNLPALAQSAIGQNDVAATPLQMALVAAGVANDGVIMKPYVVQEIRDGEGDVLEETNAKVWRQAVDGPTARTMREAMIGVVERPDGTAGSLAIEGFEVGGKTGTAQLGTDPPRSHAWIIGFAGPPGGQSEVAVAVIVEGEEGASEQTGGSVASPIARAMMEAALAVAPGG
jgi:peptidoglycan glycosyltransferase